MKKEKLIVGNPENRVISHREAIGDYGAGLLAGLLDGLDVEVLFTGIIKHRENHEEELSSYQFASLDFTIDDWWQCECDNNYTHKKSHRKHCAICNSKEEDCADACLSEVLDYLQETIKK